MAITVNTTADERFADYYLHRRVIDFDSSYPTGGEALTAANLGFSDNAANLIVWALPKGGFSFEYDGANAKMKVNVPVAKYSAALNPASMTTDAANSTAVTVTGVASTDICVACQPVATLEAGIVVQSARVTGADQITVEATNASAGTVDAASGTCDFYVVRANGASHEVPDTTDLSGLTGVTVYALGKVPA